MSKQQWTTPYYGIQHLESADGKYRASVYEWSTGAELSKWVPGCGFSPETIQFGRVEAARLAGESWLASITNRVSA